MKRDSVPHFLLVLGVLAVAGLIIWPGCATPPLPATRTPLSNLRAKDFKFPRGSQPTRAELEAQLGKPDDFFEDLGVACYRLNRVRRRRLWLFLCVLPIAAPRDPDVIEVALVQFDAQQRVSRVGVKTEQLLFYFGAPVRSDFPGGGPSKRLRWMVERWLAEPKPVPMGTKR
jgi:hypothetical protein